MAIPVARVHLATAHAALPSLLPAPPKSKMLPLIPTPPCTLILPMSPPKPASRADDTDEKWGATKSPSKPRRSDSVERWDAHKTVKPAIPTSSSSGSSGKSTGSSPGRASSCERWDSNKKSATCSWSTSSRSSSASRASSSSAERWDAHKKPRQPQAGGIDDDDGQSSTGSNDVELDTPPPQQREFYAGPGFLASPDPSMLPMPSPSLLMRRVSAARAG